MAATEGWVLDVVRCDLCDKPTQQFCNSCQVSLCKDCVSEHTDKYKSLSHEIVYFLDRKVQLEFPECQDHPGQRCELNCKECNRPVCLKRIVLSGHHKNHNVEELKEIYESRIKEIEAHTQKLKSDIMPKYEKADSDIGVKISQTKTTFNRLKKENKKLREVWQQEVKNIFDKIDSVNQSFKQWNIDPLTECQSKIKNMISKMTTVQLNEQIIKSKKFAEAKNYRSRLDEYQNDPEKVDIKMPSLNTNTENGKELNLKIGGYKVTLKQEAQPGLPADVSCLTTEIIELMERVTVVKTIDTSCRPLLGIVCVGEAEALICGENRIFTRIDTHGSIKDTVNTCCPLWPDSISMSREGAVIFSDSDNRTVKLTRQWQNEVLVCTPGDRTPKGVCCTRSGDILVHVWRIPLFSLSTQNKMEDTFINKIVRYRGCTKCKK